MDTTKRYALYHFKRSLLITAIGVAMSVLVTLSSFIYTRFLWENNNVGHEIRIEYANIYIVSSILTAFAFALPILEFYEFKNRRNLDTWFSFPISRAKLALVHYINGALIMIISSLCVSITATVLMLISENGYYSIGSYWGYYFVILFFALCFYSFMTFIFAEVNTAAEGIFFEFTWAYMPIAIYYLMTNILDYLFRIEPNEMPAVLSYIGEMISPTTVSNTINECFIDIVNKGIDKELADVSIYDISDRTDPLTSMIISIVFWALIGVLSVFLLTRSFRNRKTENVGGVTESWVGYKLWLPIMAVVMLLLVPSCISRVFFTGLLLIMYSFYRRGFKNLKKSDIIFIVAVGVISAIPVSYLEVIGDLIG